MREIDVEPVECPEYNAYFESHKRVYTLYLCGLITHDEMTDRSNQIDLDKQIIFGGSHG